MTTREYAGHVGLLALRIGAGCFMLVHGWQKLTGFGDMAETFPDPLGIGSRLSLLSAIGAEFGCSLLLIAGLGTRLAALPLAFTMIVALFVVHADDPWRTKELAAIYLLVYVVIMLNGPGRYSVDGLLLSKWSRKSDSVGDSGDTP